VRTFYIRNRNGSFCWAFHVYEIVSSIVASMVVVGLAAGGGGRRVACMGGEGWSESPKECGERRWGEDILVVWDWFLVYLGAVVVNVVGCMFHVFCLYFTFALSTF